MYNYMENISNVNAFVLTIHSTSEMYNSEMVRWSGASYAAVYPLFNCFVGFVCGISLTQFLSCV